MKKFLLGFVVGLLFCGLAVVIFAFAAIRLGDTTPSLVADTTLVLHLEGDLPEQAPVDVPPIPMFLDQQPMTMLEVWKVLHKAALDSRIKALILEPRGLSAGWAKIEELRAGVQEFKKSGKPVYAYLRTGGAHEYFVATAADKIYMAPEDFLDVKGLRADLLYFKGALEKVGVQMEFEGVGKYKDAPDQYTRDSPRPETIEVMNQVVDQFYGSLVQVIAEGRKKKLEDVRATLDQGPFTGKDAVQAGLIDKLIYEDEVMPGFRDAKKITGRDYNKVPVANFQGGSRIAVVTGQGEITRGATGETLGDDGITDSGMLRVLKQVEKDDNIKGVIFRVDSPGGDSIASDEILHAMKILSAKKPVVISMSDLAASGGYFISMTGDPILAYPNTLTGSIGVFYGRVSVKGLADKVGLSQYSIARGRFAQIDSPFRPLTLEERAKLRQEIEVFYKGFVERVAASRKRPYAEMETLAQGRVWLGAQAKQNGLIDELGGLDRAVELIKSRAKLAASDKVTLVSYPPRRTLVQYLLSQGGDETAAIDAQVRAVLGVRLPLRSLARGGVMRLMPYSLEVK